ncbi:MAG TPA: hypothetical protein PKY62_02930, partial [Actinotalea sp.]|nr:hypothetical protein [Actinotalea sp.]
MKLIHDTRPAAASACAIRTAPSTPDAEKNVRRTPNRPPTTDSNDPGSVFDPTEAPTNAPHAGTPRTDTTHPFDKVP